MAVMEENAYLVENVELRPLGNPIGPIWDGMRVDKYLAVRYPFLSRTGWKKKIDDLMVYVNGTILGAAYRVRTGDRIGLHPDYRDEPLVDDAIRLVWEEKGVMAVFKPGNLPMHENGPYRKNTFYTLVHQKFGEEWSAIHRLDRETSGIVLCAATPQLRQKITDAFQERKIKKEYRLIVRGKPARDEWVVEAPIGDIKNGRIRIKRGVVDDGLPAETHFITLEEATHQGQEYALLKALPKTGRTNQIRVHAAWSGFPLVGDKLYHPDERVFLDYYEFGNSASVQERAGFHRHCLHAAGLKFRHPVTKEDVDLFNDLPPDMEDLWGRIKKG